jgi:hypothetical protein
MNFSPQNLKTVTVHKSPLVGIHQFQNNESDHFISISEDSELKEWITLPDSYIKPNGEKYKDICTCTLSRPSDQFLIENRHKVSRANKNSQIIIPPKITKCLCFDNFIINGYEDGLILVWAQKVSHTPPTQFDDELNLINDLNNKISDKFYTNTFSLYFVFIGHTHNIINIFYLRNRNYLISTSDDNSVKFYDFTNGNSIYKFSLDSTISHIFNFTDMKKNEYVILLAKESFKITINISKTPFSFTSTLMQCHLNETNSCAQSLDGKYHYLLGNKGNIFILDQGINLISEVIDKEVVGYMNILKFGSNFILFDNQRCLRFVEINLEKKEIVLLFKIQIGNDNVISSMIHVANQNLVIMGSRDGKVYELDINGEKNLHWNRVRMRDEEKISVAFNTFLRAKSTKKRKKPGTAKGRVASANKTKSGKGQGSKSKERPVGEKKEAKGEKSSKSQEKKKEVGGKKKSQSFQKIY